MKLYYYFLLVLIFNSFNLSKDVFSLNMKSENTMIQQPDTIKIAFFQMDITNSDFLNEERDYLIDQTYKLIKKNSKINALPLNDINSTLLDSSITTIISDSISAIYAGTILNVDKVILGVIAKFGDVNNFTLKVYDVKSKNCDIIIGPFEGTKSELIKKVPNKIRKEIFELINKGKTTLPLYIKRIIIGSSISLGFILSAIIDNNSKNTKKNQLPKPINFPKID